MNGLLINLVGAWAMETLPTLDIPDLSGGGNPIVDLSGSVWSNVSGKNGNAVDQGGDTGNQAGVAHPHPFHFLSSFTLNFWINRNAAEYSDGFTDSIHGVWDDTTGKNWYCIWNATADVFQLGVSQNGTSEVGFVQTPSGFPAADTWHMVTCGYDQDASTTFMQFNSGARATNSVSGALFGGGTRPLGTMNFIFSGQRACTGAHDEIGLWNRALTMDDVTNLYASGSGLFFSSFDSGSAGDTGADYNYYYRSRVI